MTKKRKGQLFLQLISVPKLIVYINLSKYLVIYPDILQAEYNNEMFYCNSWDVEKFS